MLIGIRLHDTAGETLENRVDIAASQGFFCAHLALSKVIRDYSTAPSALTPGLALHIKRLFEKRELDIAVLGCYLNLANPDSSELKRITDTYISNIRFASLLGCGVVGTETGAPNKEYRYCPQCHSEQALEMFTNNLSPIISAAEKSGVIVAIEPVFKHIVCNPKRARQLLDRISSPNLQIIFDPVNLLDISNYKNADEIFSEAIELLGKDIAVIHIKDFIVKGNELISVAAGTGMMDYSQIMSFMKREKPYIHVSLENTTPENAVAAREFIEEQYNKA